MTMLRPVTRVLMAAMLTVSLLVAAPAAIARAPGAAPASFADLVEKLTPAVVNISTTQKIQSPMAREFPGMPPLGNPELDKHFRDFFERMLPPGMAPFGGNGPAAPEREVFSLGSGFIIDASGYIVTNSHVIAQAEEIKVILSDNTQLSAEVVGRDSKTDLALLKVTTDRKLPHVTWGDSSKARVGDWVIAIGNPFGLGGTVTAGIISARSRNINAGPFDDFIQTDAAINRGNSGGPLFNTQGEVIGVNTAIFSPTGGNIGIGFAAPETLARSVIAQLREHGRTFRGWLGVQIQQVTDEMAESMGLGKARGALVMDVSKDSPSEKAGVLVGDVILSFDGKEIGEMRELPRLVADTAIGKKVAVNVFRDGKQKTLGVTLGELQEETQTARSADPTEKPTDKSLETHTFQGMQLAELNSDLRNRFVIAQEVEGLLVLRLEGRSTAAQQGVTEGDVVVQVNDTATSSINGFKKALKTARKDKKKNVLLRINRSGNNVFLTVPTDEK